MLEGECPVQTCVHMGWLDSSAMPTVCVPIVSALKCIEYAKAEMVLTQ